MVHSLEGHWHGYFSRELEPALTIDPGDTVRFKTLDSGWGAEPYAGGAYAPRRRVDHADNDEGHALTGPVAIRGARAGMTLRIDIGELRPGAWGAVCAGGWLSAWNERLGVVGDGIVHAYQLDAATMTGCSHLGHTVALRPFLGVMGLPPDKPGRHSTVPPRACGGNLDCRELVTGSTLYLPIEVDGALFSCGDGHAAQGDGEVAGTALECPMERAELTFELSDLELTTPIARGADGSWITLGVHEDLDEAAFSALDAMLELLEREYGLARRDALAIASVHVDLRVTQLVNEVRGVHAVLRDWR
ncbi:acetamidase/formamidase family protein [Solirubrobacter ginsenosidimutans]|uniref:Acetamidase/formamidase family protein n=1 Tax=Solirubrobacter ginsenosidimutans TaxID=490573 RepID=A0A9X3S4F2_9ACTN|nr:acetamidase/formamidase family protein [Solirubrobacter ginsenosidimutans]MDA0166620.1 acetamidase/formamidase family protein [Solirubrobacter ginsenosidimutans]